MNNFQEFETVNSGESYLCLADDVPALAALERMVCPRAHSFTPLISTFAGDRWRKMSEGVFTHVLPAGGDSVGEEAFKIRLSVQPARADDLLRSVVPIIVSAGCPFKVIANTALLELVCARSSSGESAGDFMTIYPSSQKLFNDLTAKLQGVTQNIKSSCIPMPLTESIGQTELAPDFVREEEQLELTRRLQQGIVTVVLGPRGAGKSALLRAGFKPELDRVRFEPVYLRLQFAGEAHPVQQVRDEINRVLRESQIDGAPFGEGQTLWEYFHQQNSGWVAADGNLVEPVLIFDQFEDVFAFDGADPATRQQVESFWTQLANLVENRDPKTISQLQRPSADSCAEGLGFKVVIGLRQDYLPELLHRAGTMPSIAHNHFLLKPFVERKTPDGKEHQELEEQEHPLPPPELPQDQSLPPEAGGRVHAELIQNGDLAQTTDLKQHQEPEEKKFPPPALEPPLREPLSAQTGGHLTGRLKFLAYGLGLLLTATLAVLVVMYIEEIQKQQTEVELQEYISNVATAGKTFKAANRKLTLAELNIAIEKSNILALDQKARAQELEAQSAKEQNSKLAGEQTNFQSRISQLDREKAQAESRLAQWSGLLVDLTNQIARLNKQKEELKARNEALAATHGVSVTNIIENRPANTNLSRESLAATAMEIFPGKLPSSAMPDADISSRRQVDVLSTNGECLYSEDGTKFRALPLHGVLFEGAVIQTGKGSWSDLFIRKTGTTVRLAPESQMKIAKLSETSENGVLLLDTRLELRSGRIFTVVRSLAPSSTLEISDAAGHSVIEGGGLGCFMITAPGPDSAGKLLLTPLRVIAQKGTSVIAPGQSYSAKDGVTLSLIPSSWETKLLQLDELESETDKAIAQPEPARSTIKN
jgi:hypothetical protein